MSTEEFSTENLLILLDQIKAAIQDGSFTEDAQERVWNALFWDKDDPDNKEMIKYLFTGWWIHYNLKQEYNLEPTLEEMFTPPTEPGESSESDDESSTVSLPDSN